MKFSGKLSVHRESSTRQLLIMLATEDNEDLQVVRIGNSDAVTDHGYQA